MTTSTVLRTLQTKDLIKRKEHLTDTRAKTVELTKSGRKTVKNAVKTVEDFDKIFFETLGHKTKTFNEQLLALIEQGKSL